MKKVAFFAVVWATAAVSNLACAQHSPGELPPPLFANPTAPENAAEYRDALKRPRLTMAEMSRCMAILHSLESQKARHLADKADMAKREAALNAKKRQMDSAAKAARSAEDNSLLQSSGSELNAEIIEFNKVVVERQKVLAVYVKSSDDFNANCAGRLHATGVQRIRQPFELP